jgi:anti-anti-sigma factor
VNIVEELIGDVLVEIVNVGRASFNEAAKFKEMLNEKIKMGTTKIVVDLTACEFIDSTFLGVLVSVLRKVSKEGGDLRLVGFKPAVRAMFELTRMFRVFESYEDLKEAVDSFSK